MYVEVNFEVKFPCLVLYKCEIFRRGVLHTVGITMSGNKRKATQSRPVSVFSEGEEQDMAEAGASHAAAAAASVPDGTRNLQNRRKDFRTYALLDIIQKWCTM